MSDIKADTLCACGHPPSETSGPGTGYAKVDGVLVCYTCCDLLQRIDMQRAHIAGRSFSLYVDLVRDEITTWSGGVMATITYSKPAGYTDRFGLRPAQIRCVDVHGNYWYGRGAPGACITLRPMKGEKRYV